ncbi:hypothetical protein CBL_01809 [Carabus blaptoides fortunei]
MVRDERARSMFQIKTSNKGCRSSDLLLPAGADVGLQDDDASSGDGRSFYPEFIPPSSPPPSAVLVPKYLPVQSNGVHATSSSLDLVRTPTDVCLSLNFSAFFLPLPRYYSTKNLLLTFVFDSLVSGDRSDKNWL